MPVTNKKEIVKESIPFLSNDSRWAGVVEVVEREQTFDDGKTKTFIDMRMKVKGRPTTPLPRRGLRELILALEKADKAAAVHYNEIIQRTNGSGKTRLDSDDRGH